MVVRIDCLSCCVAMIVGLWQASGSSFAADAPAELPGQTWGDSAATANPLTAESVAPLGEKAASRGQTGTGPEALLPPAPRSRTSSTRPLSPPNAARDELAFLTARAPNIFGHFFNLGGTLQVVDVEGSRSSDLPLAGACGRLSVAENNNALPQDRAYFLYNHFHNALEAGRIVGGQPGSEFSVDRYVFGVEKTYACGLWSVEARMPLAGQINYARSSLSVDGGSVGNLAIIAKRILRQTDMGAISAGLGVDAPLGSDVRGEVNGIRYTVHNEAVHLHPYACLYVDAPTGSFCQGFIQVDVPMNGNGVDAVSSGNALALGTWTEQPLFHVDLALGRWLIRNRQGVWLKSLAGVLEFHYISTLSDADEVSQTLSGTTFIFGNLADRVDLADLTIGLHGEISRALVCRVGCVLPLKTNDNRAFDAELQVQLERRF